jgi:hypothetical protein
MYIVNDKPIINHKPNKFIKNIYSQSNCVSGTIKRVLTIICIGATTRD